MKITKHQVRSATRKVVTFSATNVIGTIVDTIVLWIFSHLVFKHFFGQVIVSPLISFEFAVFANFCCSYFVTWKSRIYEHTKKSFVNHFWVYNASCIGGFLIKMIFLIIIERLSGWDVVICNLIALCFSGIFNFSMGEFVIFKKKKKKEDAVTDSEGSAGDAACPEQ